MLCRCFDLDALSTDGPGGLSKSFSMDSLMEDDSLGMVEDVPGYYDAQKSQIFLGMTTLQYQARQVCHLARSLCGFYLFIWHSSSSAFPAIFPGFAIFGEIFTYLTSF